MDAGELPFGVEFFTDARELKRLLPFCERGGASTTFDHREDCAAKSEDCATAPHRAPPSTKRDQLRRLTGKFCELVDDFNLVCFQPLDISDGESVANLVRLLDKAVGPT